MTIKMTGEKVGNLTRDYNDESYAKEAFLPYSKNHVNAPKSTLYENLQFFDTLGLLRNDGQADWFDNMNTDYKFYEYVPYEVHRGGGWWYDPDLKNKPGSLAIFKALKQYRLKATYNFNEQVTVQEAKESLLIPCTDKVLSNKNILATLFFFNRLTTENISFEVFLFCDDELNEQELDNIMASPARTNFNGSLLAPENSTYGFYKFYCEVFLNSNVLTASSFILSFGCKSYKQTLSRKLGTEVFKDTQFINQSGDTLSFIFNCALSNLFQDGLRTISSNYNFDLFLQVGPYRESMPLYCLALGSSIGEQRDDMGRIINIIES